MLKCRCPPKALNQMIAEKIASGELVPEYFTTSVVCLNRVFKHKPLILNIVKCYHTCGIKNMSSTLLAPTNEDRSVADHAIFERASRRYLQMSAEEFLEKWNGGFFKQHPELAHKAADVALLLPLLSAR